MWGQSLGQEDPLEWEMATHSSTLAWEIPWTERSRHATVHGVAKELDTTEQLSNNYIHTHTHTHPSMLVVKNLPANAADIREVGLMLGWEDPLEREMATHSSILTWEIPGQRSLVGYSPWGHRELDMTEAT